VADANRLTDKQLEILHDHYKETFARIQQLESSRDRLLVYVIGLFALLGIEIIYPTVIGGILGKFTFAGGELDLRALPLPVLLNASWILSAAISLKYCQTTISVSRQYPYLHKLEETISAQLGGGIIYHREGKIYFTEYPFLLDVAWLVYGVLFPFLVIISAFYLAREEANVLLYPELHKLLDLIFALAIIFFFFSYRIQPSIWHKVQRWRSSKQKSTQKQTS